MKSLYKVLLIDDDPAVNFLHQMLFEDLNAVDQIVVKEKCTDALQFIKQGYLTTPPDYINLILLDLNMPDMSGFNLLEELIQLDLTELVRTKIVVVTSSTHPKDIRRLEILGVKNIYEKPLTIEKITGLLNDFVDNNN
jgi:response regulator of citrate/malate metabolism